MSAEIKVKIIICSNRPQASIIRLLQVMKQPKSNIRFLLILQSYKLNWSRPFIDVINFPKKIGVSNARNIALTKILSSSDIVIFTDDDCVFDNKWIKEILNYFSLNKRVDMVFGKTLPFPRKKMKDAIYCPSIFDKSSKKETLTNSIQPHWEKIGFSNNMAVRSKVFKKIGGFRPWLGPGSFGLGGEDAEFIVRAILNGHIIGYSSKILLYHDRWLTEDEMFKQSRNYTCGGIAAYGYYTFKGVYSCFPLLWVHIYDSFITILKISTKIKKTPNLQTLKYIMGFAKKEVLSILRGFIIAFYYSVFDRAEYVSLKQ